MLVLVLSDFHLGKGRFFRNGDVNILEDFFEDDRFVEFLDHYSNGVHHWSHVHLILNGDILNLVQIDINGVFSHIVDEERTIRSLDLIHKGHRAFFDALHTFLQKPNKKVTYIIGNHDAGMAFPGAQKRFSEILGGEVEFTFNKKIGGVYIEHGHRFEVINTVPQNQYFLDGPNGTKILNLPWGSLFCANVLPRLKKDRPYLDKVRPLAAYVKWTLVHDFAFFLKMFWTVLRYLYETSSEEYTRQNRNFKTTMKLLKQVTIYPRYARMAKRILSKDDEVHTVVMGHTHLHEWRRFPEGKYYFNTGTWNTIPSIDAGLGQSVTKLTYVLLDVNNKNEKLREASMNVWQGKWRPFRQEISTLL